MSTPWSDINEMFFDKVEEDSGFFNYFELSEDEAVELATERANSCLKEAAARFELECGMSDVNFLDYDSENEQFNFDLTPTERYIMCSLQYEAYIARDIAKIKVFELNFVPSDLTVFDPSNARRSFMQMYESVKDENRALLDNYKSKDRLTNQKRAINYTEYDE